MKKLIKDLVKVITKGSELYEIYPHATRFQVFSYRFMNYIRYGVYGAITVAFFSGLMYGAFHYGYKTAEPTRVEAVVVEYKKEVPPIMKKIAKCESGDSHFDKHGQVLINATRDSGRYQINVPVWGKTATQMGLDLMNEEDNEKFAMWLFENKGSAPWSSSSACWTKL